MLGHRVLPCNRVSRDRTLSKAVPLFERCASFKRRLRLRRWQRLAGRRTHALVDEALEAAAVEVLANIDVALAVDRKRMRHVQRSAKDPLLPEMIENLERLAQKNPDVVVGAVDHVEEPLIGRECEPGGGAGEQRSARDEAFPHEGTVGL